MFSGKQTRRGNSQNLIAQSPESAAEILPGIRKRALRKFRYSLIYTIEKDGLLIFPELQRF